MWTNDSFSWLQAEFEQESRNVTTPDTLMDLVRNVFPPNLIQATMQQYRYAAVINDKKTTKTTKIYKNNKTNKTTKTTKTTQNDNKTTTENFLYNMHIGNWFNHISLFPSIWLQVYANAKKYSLMEHLLSNI